MENRKFYLGMLVLVLTFAMTVVSCGDKSGTNNFDGRSFTMDSDKSTLKFSKNTWTWDNHVMNNSATPPVPTKYHLRGDYTCSNNGNTATMISTDYNTGGDWTPYKGQWTATLNGTRISTTFDGAVKSIISLDELIGELELTGYQVR